MAAVIPLPSTAWLIAGAAAAGFALGGVGAWKTQGWRLGNEIAAIHAAQATAAATAAREARLTESRRSLNVLEAQNAATRRAQIARADADRARSELDSLRNTLATRRGGVPDESPAACVVRADTTADVLSACAAEAQELARAADGHAADARALTEAWPK